MLLVSCIIACSVFKRYSFFASMDSGCAARLGCGLGLGCNIRGCNIWRLIFWRDKLEGDKELCGGSINTAHILWVSAARPLQNSPTKNSVAEQMLSCTE